MRERRLRLVRRGSWTHHGTSRRRRRARVGMVLAAVAVATVVAVVTVPFLARLAASDAGAPQAPAAPASVLPAPTPALVAAPDLVASAVAWLRVTREVSYTDRSPTAWTGRARPVVTDRVADAYARLRDAGGGVDWSDFVTDQCVTAATGVDGVIPPEAPRTAALVNVQVAGQVITTCRRGDPARHPPLDVAATVTLLRGPDGRWRVDDQLY